MTNDFCIPQRRIGLSQCADKFCKLLILNRFIRTVIGALKFYPDRKVIAFRTVAVAGLTRMPSTLLERNVLSRATNPRDQHVARYAKANNFFEIGMVTGNERVCEQIVNQCTTEFPRWEADPVDDYQVQHGPGRALITVRGVYPPHPGKPSGVSVYVHVIQSLRKQP